MKSLVDHVEVTYDEIVNISKTTLIKPNGKTDYLLIAVVLFLHLLVGVVIKS